jgi:hypothetical protein
MWNPLWVSHLFCWGRPAGDETLFQERMAFSLSFAFLSQVKERLIDRNIEM